MERAAKTMSSHDHHDKTTEHQGNVGEFTCPMHPDVRGRPSRQLPEVWHGAWQPVAPAPIAAKTEYVCPMHPEIIRAEPGNCPICGMTLEPRVISSEEGESPELADMTRRLWVSVALAIPLLFLAMSEIIPGQPVQRALPMLLRTWIELALATPAVLWAGWPLLSGWQSIVNRSLNMFTLIAMGVGVGYGYSLFAALFPQLFPHPSVGRMVPCPFILRWRRSSRRWIS